jgi:pimeloyl-ACP methyl ester carboxylesterase/DNA-binding CsgD family transcriptional regulator
MIGASQTIRFCTSSDGVRIAFTTLGRGPALVKAANWLTHIEFDHASSVWRHWLAELSRGRALTRYDVRGCGLSDWDAADLSFEGWVRDLEAVVDAAQLPSFALIGLSQGGAVSIAYAARHPERVSHLVLCGAFARGRLLYAKSQEERDEYEMAIRLAELGWDRENPAFRQTFATQLLPDGTQDQQRSVTEMMRLSTSATNAGRILREVANLDVTSLAPLVRCPTLVIHSRRDTRIPFEEGRLLAAMIPGARFIPLEGCNHIMLETEPSWQIFTRELSMFLPRYADRGDVAHPLAQLSAREVEVLELIAQGLDNQQIAGRLSRSEKTVRNHITAIFSKLHVRNRAQAIVQARVAGLGHSADGADRS